MNLYAMDQLSLFGFHLATYEREKTPFQIAIQGKLGQLHYVHRNLLER
jgi:hypothetical protein